MKIAAQTGATMTELLVALPLIVLLGLIGIQYALMYNAKSNLSYASYEAARAGAIHHADPIQIQEGLLKGLLPYMSATGEARSGDNTLAAQAQIEKIKLNEAPFMKVEIISPSQAAFDDFHNAELAARLLAEGVISQGQKVIPNASKDIQAVEGRVGSASGATIHEANTLKLRITYGYKPKIPLAKNMFISIQNILASTEDAFALHLLKADRIPITVDVTAQMLSPAVENGLRTTAYNPPRGTTPIGSDRPMPDLGGIRLPEGYESMTVEQIISILMNDPENGAGQVGGAKRSYQEWLAILAALGILGAGAYSNTAPVDIGATGDFTTNQQCTP